MLSLDISLYADQYSSHRSGVAQPSNRGERNLSLLNILKLVAALRLHPGRLTGLAQKTTLIPEVGYHLLLISGSLN